MAIKHMFVVGFLVLGFQAVDLEAFAQNSGNNGNHKGGGNNGNGKGNGGPNGGGGGAPLPALGVTLLGQALGGGGLYLAWRRRRRKP